MSSMAPNNRNQMYYRLSSQLAQVDNAQLQALLGDGEPSNGWGRNHTVDLNGDKIFVKRVPLTDIEHENMLSTANLYKLPTFYNYGAGSVGLGVWRELVAHIKTTNWVLSGQTESFPLLYHYRVMPFWGTRTDFDLERHERFVTFWGNNERISQYMLDRTSAKHELVLILEYVPHVLHPWLLENPAQLPDALEKVKAAVDFLHRNGMMHLDAHSYNILTDGDQIYLTDFGLVLDRNFPLQADEISYFDNHISYDYAEIISEIGYLLYTKFNALPEDAKKRVNAKFAIAEDAELYDVIIALTSAMEQLRADADLNLHPVHIEQLIRYQAIIVRFIQFFVDLRRNNNKDTPFPNTGLRSLLLETGFTTELPAGLSK